VEIVFPIPHLFGSGTSPRENAEGLRALLDLTINLNTWFLRHHSCPPLYGAGVVYGRTDDWECIPALYANGYHGTNKPGSNFPAHYGRFGDCKSLTAALVAEYRFQGRAAEPVFRFADLPGNSRLFHILVLTDNGFEDPSKVLGMGKDEFQPFASSLVNGRR
jgi:hypothetical protein